MTTDNSMKSYFIWLSLSVVGLASSTVLLSLQVYRLQLSSPPYRSSVLPGVLMFARWGQQD